MPRRGSSGIQALVLVAVLLLFIYGYYSYNELKSTLKKSEETLKRVKLQEENVSAQLLALSEQKSQLDETLKKERDTFNKEKLANVRLRTELEKKSNDEKTSLLEEIRKIKEGYEALQAQQQKHEELDKEHAAERQKLTSEKKLLKQSTDNEIANLKDDVADLKRVNNALLDKIANLTRQNDVGKQQSNVLEINKQQQPDRHVKKRNDEDRDEVPMQIKGPMEDKQAYFAPRSAKPDHPVVAGKPVRVLPVGGQVRGDQVHAQQVVPPNLEQADDNDKDEDPDAALADDEDKSQALKRGVKARQNGNAYDHHLNPFNNDAARIEKNVQQQQQQPVRRNLGGFADRAQAGNGIFRANGAANVDDHQIEKPQHVREPRPNDLEEDQVPGPALHNEQNANERDDAADADEDDDYRYDDNKNKGLDKEAVDGPHAAPVDEDDENKDGGL